MRPVLKKNLRSGETAYASPDGTVPVAAGGSGVKPVPLPQYNYTVGAFSCTAPPAPPPALLNGASATLSASTDLFACNVNAPPSASVLKCQDSAGNQVDVCASYTCRRPDQSQIFYDGGSCDSKATQPPVCECQSGGNIGSYTCACPLEGECFCPVPNTNPANNNICKCTPEQIQDQNVPAPAPKPPLPKPDKNPLKKYTNLLPGTEYACTKPVPIPQLKNGASLTLTYASTSCSNIPDAPSSAQSLSCVNKNNGQRENVCAWTTCKRPDGKVLYTADRAVCDAAAAPPKNCPCAQDPSLTSCQCPGSGEWWCATPGQNPATNNICPLSEPTDASTGETKPTTAETSSTEPTGCALYPQTVGGRPDTKCKSSFSAKEPKLEDADSFVSQIYTASACDSSGNGNSVACASGEDCATESSGCSYTVCDTNGFQVFPENGVCVSADPSKYGPSVFSGIFGDSATINTILQKRAAKVTQLTGSRSIFNGRLLENVPDWIQLLFLAVLLVLIISVLLLVMDPFVGAKFQKQRRRR